MKIASKPLIVVAAVGAVALGLGGYVWKEENRPAILEVYVFSLSSGRSIFIRTPEDKRILIDGGGNSDIVDELTQILPFYSRRIDAVVATNSEGNNVSGLIDVLNRYIVDAAYVPAITLQSLGLASSTDQIYQTFLDTVASRKLQAHELKAGDSVSLDKKVQMAVLFPQTADKFVYSKASAPELLFRLSFGAISVTFIGNASNKVQKAVASSSEASAIKSDVLIVTHSALPENLATQLISILKPNFLVYSKSLSKAASAPVSASSKTSKKKTVTDPLLGIVAENRFNTKEKNVHITSDGISISFK